MDMLWKRRAALFTTVFVFAGFSFPLLSLRPRLLLPAFALLLLLLSLLPFLARPLKKRLPEHSVAVFRILLSAVALSFLFFGAFFQYNSGRLGRLYDGQKAEITGTVLDTCYTTSYMGAYKTKVVLEGETFTVILQTEDLGLARGDMFSAEVTFSRFPEYSGAFPESRYYHSLGAVLYAEAESVEYLGQAPATLLTRIASFRDSMSGYLFARLGREDGSLTAALFLGDRSQLDEALSRDFRRLGISHLLAISGMHFTVLLSAIDRFLRPVLPSRKQRMLILTLANIFYMMLCGLSETVVRAGIMLLFTYLGFFLSRRADTPTSLGIAAFLLTILDPYSIYSVGFQLSVAAVLGICVFDHLKNTLRKKDAPPPKPSFFREALETILLSFVIQIALLPLTCLYFGETSLLAPLATVLFSPLMDALLILTPLYLLFSFLAPLQSIIGFLLHLLVRAITEFTGFLAPLRGITLSLAYPFAAFFCLALSATVFTTPLCRERSSLRRHLTVGIALFLSFLVSVAAFEAVNTRDVNVISVNRAKNDAVVILSKKDALLIDISDGTYSTLSSAYAAAAKAGATEIEGLFLTHLHSRHTTSIQKLAKATYVHSLFLPEPKNETEETVFQSLADFCEKDGIPLYVYDTTDTISWGDNIEILPLFRTYLSRSTHPILGFSVRTNGILVTYLSTSATEQTEAIDQSETDSDLGSHGPIDKAEVHLALSEHLSAAVCRHNSTLYENARSLIREAGALMYEDEVIYFTLKPQ